MEKFIKKNIKSFYIDNIEFYCFKNKILSNFLVGIQYSLLYKVKYDEDEYRMLSPQQGFKLNSLDDVKSIELLYDDLVNKLDNFLDKYNSDNVELIQVMYITLSDNPKLKLTNIN